MKFKMVSILYKYNISQSEIMIDGDCEAWCRSFISIIFPYPLEQHIRFLRSVSILYKYHISLAAMNFSDEELETGVDPL